MHTKFAGFDYAMIERAVHAYRRGDRAFHLPLIGFLLGGAVGTLLWAGIAWALCAVLA